MPETELFRKGWNDMVRSIEGAGSLSDEDRLDWVEQFTRPRNTVYLPCRELDYARGVMEAAKAHLNGKPTSFKSLINVAA